MIQGYLHIITTPVSGDIFINNEYRGTKDINVKVNPGVYNIKVSNILNYITPDTINSEVFEKTINEIILQYRNK